MRHAILSLALMAIPPAASAFEIEAHTVFGEPNAPTVVRILSTADTAFFAPSIQSFLAAYPDHKVDYTVASSAEVMRAIYEEGEAFDLTISSAMDLQTKLANDGLAQQYFPALADPLPDWAIWNNMVFAISQEPATVVVSTAAFADMPLPTSRQELINVLRKNPDRFRGRIGTYDVRTSGLGYLFATQDSRRSETYWRLTEVMGGLDAQLYCCSSEMIADVKSGKLAIAYNVLGSYAADRADDAALSVIQPADFTTVMLRTALIPATSENPDAAGRFIAFMLQRIFAPDAQPQYLSSQPQADSDRALHRIRLGPGLLVFLDQFKKRGFLAEWENAMVQN